MQTAVAELQPSLFAFKLSTPKRFPARLSFFAQDIVESLIKRPATADEIAIAFNWGYEAVIDQIRILRDDGLVAPAYNSADGDVECPSLDCEADEIGEPVRGEACANCGRDLIDTCRWQYCGGPISEFFKYAQSKGMIDGIHS